MPFIFLDIAGQTGRAILDNNSSKFTELQQLNSYHTCSPVLNTYTQPYLIRAHNQIHVARKDGLNFKKENACRKYSNYKQISITNKHG